jgi:hypothetical protein
MRGKGGDHRNHYTGGKVAKAGSQEIVRSAKETATTRGISERKIEQIRTIKDHALEPVKEAVEAGEMSISKAYQPIDSRRGVQAIEV